MASREDKVVPGGIWESPTVVVDARQHPLVITRYRGTTTDADFARHLKVLTSSLRVGKRTAVVMDTTEGSARSAASMRMLREWLETERDAMVKQLAGLALVVPSAAVRFIVSSFMLTTDLPYPYQVVEKLDDAIAYARKQLAQSN